ncbi:magnesium/cobalt transporter CorA [candidate division KSB1 bacterium]|nr:magnesium/cobalt transporter CorA [candidate division KSB1 bacterium]
MNYAIRKSSKKVGLAPGTLIHVGEQKVEKPRIRVIDFDETHHQEMELQNVEDSFPFKDSPTVTWLNIDGLHDISIIEKIGTHFDIHPLVLEDILHTSQRPKLEDYDHYIYIVLKMIHYKASDDEIQEEQFSLLLGDTFVITFQERVGDIFNPVRDRIRSGKFRIKKRKSDYLTYALIDAVIDNYFIVLENLSEHIENLEDDVLDHPSPDIGHKIHTLKRKLLSLRKSIWPLREVISELQRSESPLFEESTAPYLKDVYDHTIQVIDTIETFRDMVSGLLDTYMTSVSNRMNEVMKVLTIIATIFIPLTFLAGIYGMNFDFMPELKWHWSYFVLWAAMIIVAIIMIIFFRKKRWL